MLAHEETGKYVSERHAEATAEGKVTAGQMAQKLSRVAGFKIAAKELKEFAAEWHHSGFYRGGNGQTMGRTYFFDPDCDLQQLLAKVMANRDAEEQREAEPIVTRYFFGAGFVKRYGGRFGKKRWQPVAQFEAKPCRQSDYFAKLTEITKADYDLLHHTAGSDLESYESFAAFKQRIGKTT